MIKQIYIAIGFCNASNGIGSWIIHNYTTTSQGVSSNLVHGELYSIQHYVIKFGSDLWQVGGFLQLLQFALPTKCIAMI